MSARLSSLRLVRALAATPEDVFDAWTEPSSMRAWMCPGAIEETLAVLDVRVGGKYRIVMREAGKEHVLTGEYLEVDRPRRLAFTWRYSDTHGQVTRVTITLRKLTGERTELVLEHDAFPDEDARNRHESGWSQILEKLDHHLSA
jgi:uncharacterized protein YndB with AHSA1/START domain